MTTPNPQPQVGAIQGNISDYVRLPKVSVHNPNWPAADDLYDSAAPTFVSVKPQVIPEGTVIYRVYGGASNSVGYFWSFTKPPKTLADWRAEDAVELSWNEGNEWEQGTVKAGGAKAWVGPAAAQPAQDTNDNPLPGWLLPGGATQINIVSTDDLDILKLGKEDWG
ncbi:MAG: hypothetical protein ACI837_002849 [Crocinitomicaceae bacterium]|jgi:hypothetical protein